MHLPKAITKTAASALIISLAGCASIISGGPKTLPVMSEPDEANLTITNLKSGRVIYRGKTPFTASLERDAGFFLPAAYEFRVEKEGYLPAISIVEAGINGWYFGNLLFGGLIGFLIVDPATGAMWRIGEKEVNLKLYPDNEEGRQQFRLDREAKIRKEAEEAATVQ